MQNVPTATRNSRKLDTLPVAVLLDCAILLPPSGVAFSGRPEYMNVRWLPDFQVKPEYVLETGMMYAV